MTDLVPQKSCLLFEVMCFPEKALQLGVRQWEILLRQARSERLLARLYYHLLKTDCLQNVPETTLRHLKSAWMVAEKHELSVRWEVDRVLYALRDTDVGILLLKGAAYLMSGRSCSQGRLYTDVDILVSKEKLAQTEKALMIHGWIQEEIDEYDQQYYRKWTHEIPPLRHQRRNSLLDVHHSITPNIFRYQINYDDLISNSIEIAPRVRVLSNEDMVLHVIVHLVNEEDFSSGYRDLLDITYLIKDFSDDDFWGRVLQRAQDIGFELHLYYGLKLVQHYRLHEIDPTIIRRIEKRLGLLKWPLRYWVSRLLIKVTYPKDRHCQGHSLFLTQWLLYVRGHYLRMPLYLLVPHLLRKSFKRKEH